MTWSAVIFRSLQRLQRDEHAAGVRASPPPPVNADDVLDRRVRLHDRRRTRARISSHRLERGVLSA